MSKWIRSARVQLGAVGRGSEVDTSVPIILERSRSEDRPSAFYGTNPSRPRELRAGVASQVRKRCASIKAGENARNSNTCYRTSSNSCAAPLRPPELHGESDGPKQKHIAYLEAFVWRIGAVHEISWVMGCQSLDGVGDIEKNLVALTYQVNCT